MTEGTKTQQGREKESGGKKETTHKGKGLLPLKQHTSQLKLTQGLYPPCLGGGGRALRADLHCFPGFAPSCLESPTSPFEEIPWGL